MHRWGKWILMALVVAGLPFLLGVNGCGGASPLGIDEETEIDIGRQAAADLEREYGVVNDPVQTARLQRIGRSIARVSNRPNLPWTFRILNVNSVNALALPGGFIYVTRGMMNTGLSDAELSGVLGHEIAHVDERHSVEAIQRAMQYQLLSDLVLGRSSSALQAAADIAIQLAVQLPNSRSNEFEADSVGIRLAYNAGYPANGLLLFLQEMQREEGDGGGPEWLRTHPLTEDRISRAQTITAQVAGQPRPVPVKLSEQELKMKQLLIEEEAQEVKDRAAGKPVLHDPSSDICCGPLKKDKPKD